MQNGILSFLYKSVFSEQKPIIHDNDRLIKPGGVFVLHKANAAHLEGALRSGPSFIFLWEDCRERLAPHGETVVFCQTEDDIRNLKEGQIGAIVLPTEETPKSILLNIYGQRKIDPIAVTGTNGKTSVTTFVRQILSLGGRRCASIESGNIVIGDNIQMKLGHGLTTPSLYDMHKTLYVSETMYGAQNFVFEASSHGIIQGRIDGTNPKIAAFTSFSQDHLDYHETMEKYFEAKSLLFSQYLTNGGHAILNQDIPEFKRLKEICDQRGIKVITYGATGGDVHLISVEQGTKGLEVIIKADQKEYRLKTNLFGDFQGMNLSCAIAIAKATDPSILDKIEEIAPQLRAPVGRMQPIVGKNLKNLEIYIDYAHTPDAIEVVLSGARKITKGRLIAVFGCGGDRDAFKRPIMGKIASQLADLVFITDDNPRNEEPAAIRDEIIKGVEQQHLHKIKNITKGRLQAIKEAIDEQQDGDMVLILGKGHEDYQTTKGVKEFFSDIEAAKSIVKSSGL